MSVEMIWILIEVAQLIPAVEAPHQRMPILDLNVLRLAAFELLDRPEVPIAVVIDEAVELAKRFSTDNSGRFVNSSPVAVSLSC